MRDRIALRTRWRKSFGFMASVFDQAAGEKLIGHAPDGCRMKLGEDVPAMLDQVEALLSHAPAAHGSPPSMGRSASVFCCPPHRPHLCGLRFSALRRSDGDYNVPIVNAAPQ